MKTLLIFLEKMLGIIFVKKKHSRRLHLVDIDTLSEHYSPVEYSGHIALFPYKNPAIKNLLLALKYEKSHYAAKVVFHFIAEYIQGCVFEDTNLRNSSYLILTPPCTQRRLQQEGFNQLNLVQSMLRDKFIEQDITVMFDALVFARDVPRQHWCTSRDERIKNIQGSMKMKSKIEEFVKDKVCFIYDDITTTGATLSESQRVLRGAGAKEVITLSFAH